MPQSELTQVQCRLAKASAEALSGGAHFNFCAFELLRCDDPPNVSSPVKASEAINDPMRSVVLSGWLHGELHGPS
jgi:hypothetical protein